MPFRRVTTALVAGGTALGLLVTGCAAGPSDRPAVAVRDAPLPPPPPTTGEPPPVELPPLEPSERDSIEFGDCTSEIESVLGAAATRADLVYECGAISIELNPDEPRRRIGVSQLGVLRVGTGPAQLMVVGDVAGEPGTVLAARLANQVPPDMLTTVTLVGVDRRGTGTSDAVACVPTDIRERLVAIDPGAAQPDGMQAIQDAAGEAIRTCVQQIEDRLSVVDSYRTATDLERLRTALGSPRLNAIAVGDGSRVLSAYLGRYAVTAGRMVMDGAPDPTLDAVGSGPDLAAAAEHALDVFAADCVARGCAIAPDVRAVIERVAARLRERPVLASAVALYAGSLYTAVLRGLADVPRWPELADALAAADGGDFDGVASFVAPLVRDTGDGTRDVPARIDASMLTTCNDTEIRIPPDRVAQLATEWSERAPVFGAYVAQQLLVCGPAPVPSQTVQAPREPGTPPVLVVATAGDPLTPAIGTQRMAEALHAGVLLSWQGNGHGAFPGTPCVTDAVRGFLIDGAIPANGTVCPP